MSEPDHPVTQTRRTGATARGAGARILLLTHEFQPFAGGIATLTHGLAVGAVRLGYSVHVLAPSYDGDVALADAAQPYVVTRFAGGRFRFRRAHRMLALTRKAHDLIRTERPDLVHAVDVPSQLTLGMLVQFHAALRIGLTVCGSDLLLYQRVRPLRWLFRRAVVEAPAVSAISRGVRDLFARVMPSAVSKVFVSHPGIAPEWFSMRAASDPAIRRRCGAGPDDCILVTVARRVPEKGHLQVLAAIEKLETEERSRLVYAIIGEGPSEYAAEIRTKAARIGVRVWIPGSLSNREVADIYDISDLHVMLSEERPGRMEGFGLTYLEAGARGIPSLARAVGGVRDVVLNGQTGVVVPRDASPDAVAVELRALLADSGAARRRTLGVAARTHASQFTWERDARCVFGRLLAAEPT